MRQPPDGLHPVDGQPPRPDLSEVPRRRAALLAEALFASAPQPSLRMVADCGDWDYARLAVLRARGPRRRSPAETFHINFATD
ncbi:hypothetical protein [Micromonospora sp. NPDC002575]|uniref:hypothetical protein n=1 Tax=Micromonospora sp. NPDC002575 TaxID=3364222 RepID=UPI0036CC4D8F